MKTIFLLCLFSSITLFSSANLYTVTDATTYSTSSLAFAITQANAHLGADTIEFNIPAIQNHLIATDSIPDITDTTFINGLSQPGNIATNSTNTNLSLIGSKSLVIHSPGCEIIALKFILVNGSTCFALTVAPDSAKSISNTLIKRVFIVNYGGGNSKGILVYSDSTNGLESSSITIDSCDINSGSTGIQISSANESITGVIISNSSFFSGGYYFNEFVAENAIQINRQDSFPRTPKYIIKNNFILGNIDFTGYLDSIYFGYNSINGCNVSFNNCYINKLLFEYNSIMSNSAACPSPHFWIGNILNNTIDSLKIQFNDIKFVEFDLRLNGNGQTFNNIFFQNNILTLMESKIEKTNSSNLLPQIINNLRFNNNHTGSYQAQIHFNFQGKCQLNGLQINNNYLNSTIGNVFPQITMETDTNTFLNQTSISDNIIDSSNFNGVIKLDIDGVADSFAILNNALHANYAVNLSGINLTGTGIITNLSIANNLFRIAGLYPQNMKTIGILLGSLQTQGEIKHNTFINCTDAAIYRSEIGIDSNTVLQIDSNIIYGSYFSGIRIDSKPYNPPNQKIGTYTFLGNSIYNIGEEGIYRSSQHDTSSCMTCIPKPVLLYGECFNGITTVNGSLTGDTLTNYIIEIFSNSSPDTGGYTEGHTFIHRDTITTDATGNAIFSSTIQGNFLDSFITSTATSMVTYQTSEFSNETGVVLGTTNADIDNEISVFPNPVSRDLFIYTSTRSISQIDLIDLLGKRTSLEFSDPHSSKISLENLLPGFYFLEIHFADKTIVKKILKQ